MVQNICVLPTCHPDPDSDVILTPTFFLLMQDVNFERCSSYRLVQEVHIVRIYHHFQTILTS